jgi:hypothetical protein
MKVLLEKDKLILIKDEKIVQMEAELQHLTHEINDENKPFDKSLSKTVEYIENTINENSYTINLEEINEEKTILETKSIPHMDSINPEMINEPIFNFNEYIFTSNISYHYEDDNSNPNIDLMTYEQLLELQERIGYVNKGFDEGQIKKFPLSKFRSSDDVEKLYMCINIDVRFVWWIILKRMILEERTVVICFIRSAWINGWCVIKVVRIARRR